MKKSILKKMALLAGTAAFSIMMTTGCGSEAQAQTKEETAADAGSGEASTESTADDSQWKRDEKGNILITGIADLTPHSELIEFVTPKLAEQGYTVKLVATAADSTTNEKTQNGEIDFNFHQHLPYLNEVNETNGWDLVNAGDIHVEPITAYSDKYSSADEISDGDVIAIPNDETNEYRALRILEDQGLITLDAGVKDSLRANVDSITDNKKNLEFVEIDSYQIIPTKEDYDVFVVNTNKALEANLKSNKLFSESAKGNPYANIITVKPENLKNPAIIALVDALRSDETKKFIEEKYNGAVIPAE